MIQSVLRYALAALCFIALFPYAGFAAESGDIGLVLSLTPGVYAERAERGGQQLALEQKSPVNATDVLHTDSTGRAQILFADDSSVSLGSNTTLALEDVVAEGKSPVFKARLGQGMARFITGKIVEQNPDGFAVITPEATVGIRGTIFAVSTNDGKTTVYVMNTTRQVLVNGILVPGGYKITLPDGLPERMTPADMSRANEATASRGGPEQNGGANAERLLAQGGNSVFNPDTLEQPRLGTELAGDAITPPTAPPVAPAGPAFVTGTLSPTTFTGGNIAVQGIGSFSFTADLGNGAISNASMSNTHWAPGNTPMSYTLSNGSGVISGNALTVGGFTGMSDYNGDVSTTPAAGTMNGMVSEGASGMIVNGTYDVNWNHSDLSLTDIPTREEGSFTGQQQ